MQLPNTHHLLLVSRPYINPTSPAPTSSCKTPIRRVRVHTIRLLPPGSLFQGCFSSRYLSGLPALPALGPFAALPTEPDRIPRGEVVVALQGKPSLSSNPVADLKAGRPGSAGQGSAGRTGTEPKAQKGRPPSCRAASAGEEFSPPAALRLRPRSARPGPALGLSLGPGRASFGASPLSATHRHSVHSRSCRRGCPRPCLPAAEAHREAGAGAGRRLRRPARPRALRAGKGASPQEDPRGVGNMAASSRAQVLRLYRALLRESQRFSSYNYRMYAIRRIRDAFRENKNVKDSEKIEELVNKAKANLEVIRRQAT
uniref:Complex 1 LYR protein domain-containing protein n=1 Tax=Strigops habroptila TaxID=2489341 RepID=A0A672U611_STRHB